MPEEKKAAVFGELDSAFIDRYLRRENETLDEAKARIAKEQHENQSKKNKF